MKEPHSPAMTAALKAVEKLAPQDNEEPAKEGAARLAVLPCPAPKKPD